MLPACRIPTATSSSPSSQLSGSTVERRAKSAGSTAAAEALTAYSDDVDEAQAGRRAATGGRAHHLVDAPDHPGVEQLLQRGLPRPLGATPAAAAASRYAGHQPLVEQLPAAVRPVPGVHGSDLGERDEGAVAGFSR